MDDLEPTKEQLIQELKAVRHEFEQARLENEANEVQTELLRTVLACGENPSSSLLLRALAQQILRSANRLTSVADSSLFLLDETGTVIESVLARGAIIRQERDSLVGKVLHRGLAGWVYQQQQIGIITDTTLDDRWLQLPGEPYQVRSALCVPVLRKTSVLAIITLMHPEPGHFRVQMAELMEAVAIRIALVLDVLHCLTPQRALPSPPPSPTLRISSSPPNSPFSQVRSPKPPQSSSGSPLPSPAASSPPSSSPPLSNRNSTHPSAPPRHRDPSPLGRLHQLGLYIVVWDGKFIYANPRFAKIFGYKTQELAALKSMFSLVSEGHYDRVSEQVYKCVRGQTSCVSCIFKGKRKNGKSVLVEIYGVRTRFYGKPVLVGVLRKVRT
ncbi:GAF domain-containing protein [Sodalinema gerasimenkoae]|uniref:GAF domain-containing protein n=1 Tax=Sodalinema gerasimenkoae TaxID=2862348 RepID=UPI00135A5B50|nr:GAF domain-containing protein [Sodalinema gerasimenkoae]